MLCKSGPWGLIHKNFLKIYPKTSLKIILRQKLRCLKLILYTRFAKLPQVALEEILKLVSWIGHKNVGVRFCRKIMIVLRSFVNPPPSCYRSVVRFCRKIFLTIVLRSFVNPPSSCYLASSFTCVADMPHRRRLRSASTEQLDVPTCRRSTIGGRAFPVARAKVWNSLPSDVTSASSLPVFKNRLKTYLFRRCYENVWLSITFPFPSHYLPPQDSGPCNSFYCLGHFKNVYVDDDVTGMSYDFVVRYSLRLS